jgi:hypothetical protein
MSRSALVNKIWIIFCLQRYPRVEQERLLVYAIAMEHSEVDEAIHEGLS